jgi:receptor protein-tyrosine kinase
LPVEPVKPNKLLNISLGVILAIIGSFGVVFLGESLKNTIKGSKDVESIFGSNIIGVIPKIKENMIKKDMFKKKPSYSKYKVLDSNASGIEAERIRMLRTNFMFYLKDNNIKAVSVISAQDGDGKSTIVSNLALSIAQTGKKVLLVDGNLRNPMIDKIFEIKGFEIGLSDILVKDAKVEKATRKTNFDNLFVISSGNMEGSPSELIYSNKMKDVLKMIVNSNFDVILIDNTSLKFSESAIMASHTPAVLFVAAQDKTRKENIIKSKDALDKAKAKIMGTVLNFSK